MGAPRRFTQDDALRHLSSWVYAAAMLNANAAASVPLRMFVRKRNGQQLYATRSISRRQRDYFGGHAGHTPSRTVMAKVAEYGDGFEELVEPHPALKLLSTANSWQDGFELAVLRFLYLELTGNAYMHPVVGRVTGNPIELWLLPSQHVRIVHGQNIVSQYVYEPTEHRFEADEVIMFRRPNPLDPLGYGLGKAEALWSALGLHRAKRTMDRAKYDNMGRPDWLLIAKPGTTKDSLDRLEASVESKLRGNTQSGKFLTVTGDVTATQLNYDIPDVGDPDKIIEEIAAGFGVPLYKLRGNDPVKANSGVQDVGWLRDTILPTLRLDEETLNARYLSLWGLQDEAFLAYDDPVPANRIEQTTRLKESIAGGFVMPNEARAELNMEPVDGGDTLFVGSGVVPIALAGQQQNPFAGMFGLPSTMVRPGNSAVVTPANGDITEISVGPGPGKPLPALPAPAADPPLVDGQPLSAATPPTTDAANVILNGAQLTAAVDIVGRVTTGELPRDSGLGLLVNLFKLSPEQAEQIMGSAGKREVPTTPNPVPVTAQENTNEQTAQAGGGQAAVDDEAAEQSNREQRAVHAGETVGGAAEKDQVAADVGNVDVGDVHVRAAASDTVVHDRGDGGGASDTGSELCRDLGKVKEALAEIEGRHEQATDGVVHVESVADVGEVADAGGAGSVRRGDAADAGGEKSSTGARDGSDDDVSRKAALARPLPQGAELVGIIRDVFAEQLSKVLAEI